MQNKSIFKTEQPIISVKEAKKLLGVAYEQLDDHSLTELITELEILATITLGFS